MNERQYQAQLIQKLYVMFPGCTVIKQDAGRIQGIPDLVILYLDRWAMLEVKMEAESIQQPNQDWYIRHYNAQSFAAFIYPGNELEVLSELQRSFRVARETRLSKSK